MVVAVRRVRRCGPARAPAAARPDVRRRLEEPHLAGQLRRRVPAAAPEPAGRAEHRGLARPAVPDLLRDAVLRADGPADVLAECRHRDPAGRAPRDVAAVSRDLRGASPPRRPSLVRGGRGVPGDLGDLSADQPLQSLRDHGVRRDRAARLRRRDLVRARPGQARGAHAARARVRAPVRPHRRDPSDHGPLFAADPAPVARRRVRPARSRSRVLVGPGQGARAAGDLDGRRARALARRPVGVPARPVHQPRLGRHAVVRRRHARCGEHAVLPAAARRPDAPHPVRTAPLAVSRRADRDPDPDPPGRAGRDRALPEPRVTARRAALGGVRAGRLPRVFLAVAEPRGLRPSAVDRAHDPDPVSADHLPEPLADARHPHARERRATAPRAIHVRRPRRADPARRLSAAHDGRGGVQVAPRHAHLSRRRPGALGGIALAVYLHDSGSDTQHVELHYP